MIKKLLITALMFLPICTYANKTLPLQGYFPPVKINNQQQYDYIYYSWISKSEFFSMEMMKMESSKEQTQLLECSKLTANLSLAEFVLTNKEFADPRDITAMTKFLKNLDTSEMEVCRQIQLQNYEKMKKHILSKK